MTTKRLTLGFATLLLSSALIIGCKKEDNVAPDPDTETSGAVEAAWATFQITDIDMICSYLGENLLYTSIYNDLKEAGNGTVTPIRDTNAKYLFLAFNQTKCVDGHFRDGTIVFNYSYVPGKFPNQSKSSKYYRDFGFAGELTMSEYKVDGYKIRTTNGVPAIIYNKVSGADYSPATENLKWYLDGSFEITDPNDTSKHMSIVVKLNKTLTNTSKPEVFKPNKTAAITWTNAICAYDGTVTGKHFNGTAFTMTVSSESPITRDFTCFPESISGVAATNTPGVFAPVKQEFHPFKTGIASYMPDKKYRQEIYFGNEGTPDLAAQCDNTGVVLIKGNSYQVNFRK